MKRFTEFVQEQQEDDLMFEGLLDWFGKMAGKAEAGIKKFSKSVQDLDARTQAIYKLTMKSSTDIKDPEEQKAAKELLTSYSDCKTNEDIIKKNLEYLENHKYPDSKFNTGLITVTHALAKQSGVPQLKAKTTELKNMLKQQKEAVKQKLAAEAPAPTEGEGEGKGEGEKQTGEVTQEVTDVITDNQKLLTSLAKVANIDGKKLRSFVVKQLSWQKDENGKFMKNKSEEEIGDDIILGTCVMVCGARITNDAEAIERIAKKLNTTAKELLG